MRLFIGSKSVPDERIHVFITINHEFFHRYRGAVYADMGHFERCITLWMYALDMQQKMLEPLSPMTQSSLLSFAELFSFMMSEGRSRCELAMCNTHW